MSSGITRTLVPDEDRLNFLPKHVGKHMMGFENAIYSMMESLSGDYKGGFWNFYELDNGGFYMAPSSPETLHCMWPENYSDETVSNDAAGIVVTMFVINQFLWRGYFTDPVPYYALYDFAAQHEEGRKIFALID